MDKKKSIFSVVTAALVVLALAAMLILPGMSCAPVEDTKSLNDTVNAQNENDLSNQTGNAPEETDREHACTSCGTATGGGIICVAALASVGFLAYSKLKNKD